MLFQMGMMGRRRNDARLRLAATARQPWPSAALRAKAGGAEGIRTPDLLIANQPLYQLSYDPSLKVRQCTNPLLITQGKNVEIATTPILTLADTGSKP